jgi:hypothetical protein
MQRALQSENIKRKRKQVKNTDVAGKAVLQLMLQRVDRMQVAQERDQWQILMCKL